MTKAAFLTFLPIVAEDYTCIPHKNKLLLVEFSTFFNYYCPNLRTSKTFNGIFGRMWSGVIYPTSIRRSLVTYNIYITTLINILQKDEKLKISPSPLLKGGILNDRNSTKHKWINISSKRWHSFVFHEKQGNKGEQIHCEQPKMLPWLAATRDTTQPNMYAHTICTLTVRWTLSTLSRVANVAGSTRPEITRGVYPGRAGS